MNTFGFSCATPRPPAPCVGLKKAPGGSRGTPRRGGSRLPRPCGSPQKAPGGSRGTPRRSCSRLQRLSSPPLPPGESRGEGALSPPLPPGEGRGEGAPRGFTLVELLVVIGIIGVLAALLTPVVMRSLSKARNTAIKAEIDMLHMALMNYQSEYGVLPPCRDIDLSLPVSPYTYAAGGLAAKHLKRAFPRCADTAGQLNLANGGGTVLKLLPSNAIVAWLSGFTANPLSPLVPGSDRTKLYDFDKARIDSATAAYFPSGKRGSPYIYIDSSAYASSIAAPFSDGTNQYSADPAFLEMAFQILCAGRDERWNTDDDLSNFWPGTRREYLDSLKD